MNDRDPWAPRRGVESTPRWIRASLGGQVVADSKRAMLHLAHGPPLLPDGRPQLPGYFVPTDDVDTEVLAPAGVLAHTVHAAEPTSPVARRRR